MAMKTLREFAENARKLMPEAEWATYDGKRVSIFAKGKRPYWLHDAWIGGNQIAAYFVPRNQLSLKEFKVFTKKTFDSCIWGFTDSAIQLEEDTKRKAKSTYKKKEVIAYFPDGSTVRFSTYEECKEFFGLKRVDYVSKYIESGECIPNTSVYIDEAADNDYIKRLFNE